MRRRQKTGAYTQVDVVEAFSSLGSLLSLGLRVVRELRSGSFAVQAGLAVQEGATLLRRAASLQVSAAWALSVGAWCGRGHVRDLLGVGVLAANLGDTDV